MSVIKNYSSLASTPLREVALALVDEALTSIQPHQVMDKHFVREGDTLTILDQSIDLSSYSRVFVIAFGKGSAGIAQIVEQTLGEKLTDGYVIDTVEQQFEKLHFTLGTHPLPSEQNIEFTNNVLEKIKDLTDKDLVLVVICGGGSALFEAPVSLSLSEIDNVNKELLKSGAQISEMNVIRKHLSRVKGGGLAKHLYPARVVSLMFSDVPGNDMSVIASGPTVEDKTTMDDVREVIKKYSLTSVQEENFTETPTEDKYFDNVSNTIMVSNKTAIQAMQQKAKLLGYKTTILTDRLQGDAKKIGKVLLSETKPKEILLAGGETTVHVTGNGRGGRNQALVLAALPYVSENEIIVSFGSDGWDFDEFAGALGDTLTLQKAKEQSLDLKLFLDDDNSTEFFERVGDGILTGRLESNVSDLFFVIKQ